jgi:hypothetical protein
VRRAVASPGILDVARRLAAIKMPGRFRSDKGRRAARSLVKPIGAKPGVVPLVSLVVRILDESDAKTAAGCQTSSAAGAAALGIFAASLPGQDDRFSSPMT